MSSILGTTATAQTPAPTATAQTPAQTAADQTPAFANPPTLGKLQVLSEDSFTESFAVRVKRRAIPLARSASAIALFLGIWEFAPRLGLADPVFLPPFSQVFAELIGLFASGEILAHLQASLFRSTVGFALAVVGAIPLGLAIGWNKKVAQFLSPVLEIFRNTAALALLPVFLLILGIGETSKIALITFACSFPILLTTITAVQQVDPLLIKAARSLGLKQVDLFRKVVLPAAVPTIFTGVRMAGSASILVLIASEMMGAKSGLGYFITYTQFNFLTTKMYAGILVISLLGLSVNYALVTVERRLTRWRVSNN